MYLQREYLRDNAVWPRGATWREDLPRSGYLSAILLRVSADCASGGSADGGNWRLVDFISGIEVVGNGATVIHSYTGPIAQALSFYDQGATAPSFWRNYATNTQYDYFLLNFGRFLGDTDYFLDLSRWDSVELRFTNTATSSYYGNDFGLDVILFLLRGDDVRPPKGFFRKEIWRKWSTVAGETKYMELPTEYAIRRILLQALPPVDANNVRKCSCASLMWTIRLSLRTGLYKVFDGSLDDLMLENVWDYGRIPLTHGFVYGTADKGFSLGIGRVIGVTGVSGSKDGAASTVVPTVQGDNQNDTVVLESYEADSPVHLFAMGLGYHSTAVFRFDRDPATPAGLDPDRDKVVKLDIETRNLADATGGQNTVVLERLVSG